MIYRGCIVSIEKDFAIVLTETMEYLKVVKKEGVSVGKEIIFVAEDVYKEKIYIYKKIGFVAAMLLLMLLSIPFVGKWGQIQPWTTAVAAVISVDINPSVEFEIDKRGEVIEVIPVNEDAKELMNRDFKKMRIQDAVAIIVNNAREKGYLTEEQNAVLITTVMIEKKASLTGEGIEQQIQETLMQGEKTESLNVIYAQGDKRDLEKSRKEKVSIGKYEIYKHQEINNPITIEQIKEMKVQEMVNQGIGQLKEKKLHKKEEIKQAQPNKPIKQEAQEQEKNQPSSNQKTKEPPKEKQEKKSIFQNLTKKIKEQSVKPKQNKEEEKDKGKQKEKENKNSEKNDKHGTDKK